jgi:ligand-binding sensor domain-containing protein
MNNCKRSLVGLEHLKILLFILISLSILQVDGLGQNYIFPYNKYDYRNGIKTKFTYHMTQDKDGFIWMGAGFGLYRFDGHSFTNIVSPLDNNVRGISHLLLNIFYHKKLNRLYLISTNDIQYLDLDNYEFHSLGPDVPDVIKTTNSFKNIAKIDDNNLWISSGSIIYNYHIPDCKFTSIHFDDKLFSIVNKDFVKMYDVGEDHLLLQYSNIIFIIDKKFKNIIAHYKAGHGEYIVSSNVDLKNKERIYLSATKIIIDWNWKTGKITKTNLDDELKNEKLPMFIYDMVHLNDRYNISAIDEGDLLYDKSLRKAKYMQSKTKNIPERVVANKFFLDRDHNIWCTSYQQFCSVLYYNNQKIVSTKNIMSTDGTIIEPYKSIKAYKNNYLFVGNGVSGYGLANANLGNYKLIENKSNASRVVYDAVRIQDGSIWTCDPYSLQKITIDQEKIEPITFKVENQNIKLNGIRYLAIYGEDQVIASAQDYVYLINIHSLDIDTLYKNNLTHRFKSEPWPILKVIDNLVYFNTDEGVWIMDKYLKLHKLNVPSATNNGQKLHNAICLEKADDGNLWFGTEYNGIFIYNPSKKIVTNLTSDNTSLLNNFIYFIHRDNNEDIWVITNENVYIFDPNTLEIKSTMGSESEIASGIYGTYSNIEDSLMISHHFPYITFHKTRYNSNYTNIQNRKILFTKIVVGEKEILKVPTHNVPFYNFDHRAEKICFTFTDLSMPPPGTKRYRYKVDGLHSHWKITSQNNVCLERIPAGNYAVVVQASDNYGKWSGGFSKFEFRIKPIFYKSTWFLLLMALSGVGVIIWIYRLRIRKIKSEERFRTELNKKIADSEMKALRAQMNPHFIFNSLNSIQKFIFKNDEYSASQYLTKFSRLIRVILEQSNQDYVSINDEVNLLTLYMEMESLRFDNSFDYHITIDPKVNTLSLVPSMIIQPHVENAIWHGLLHLDYLKNEQYRKPKLEIFFDRYDNGYIRIMICDNGVGREKALEFKSKKLLKSSSFGSRISQERIQLVTKNKFLTSFKIIDKKDNLGQPLGTDVVIILPLKENYTDKIF